ncbi:MAG: hypothetical protein NTY37_11985, partial [Methanothrix sp.]|nr:hypothetical protein [Methanothrix sp.]
MAVMLASLELQGLQRCNLGDVDGLQESGPSGVGRSDAYQGGQEGRLGGSRCGLVSNLQVTHTIEAGVGFYIYFIIYLKIQYLKYSIFSASWLLLMAILLPRLYVKLRSEYTKMPEP